MPETPRTWTIRRFGPTVASGRETAVGAHLKDGEEVEVIEKAPVDAERERMLDLLERVHNTRRISSGGLGHEIEALLREQGRR